MKLTLTTLLTALTITTTTQPAVAPDNTAIVLIGVGQSWMRGTVSGDEHMVPTEQYNRSRVWVKPDKAIMDNGHWEIINERPHNYLPAGTTDTTRHTPMLEVAKQLEDKYPGRDIYVIHHGVSSTGVADETVGEWEVGGPERELFLNHILEPAIQDLRSQGINYTVWPVLTLFGASDGWYEDSATGYAGDLVTDDDSLLNEIRATVDELGLGAGVLRLRKTWGIPYGHVLNAEVDSLDEPCVFVLDANRYPDGEDQLHFGWQGNVSMARDYVGQSEGCAAD